MAVCNDASVSDGADGDSCGIVDGSDCYFTDNGEKEMIGSDIYQRLIAPVDDDLMHEVWDGTPWIVDAFTGPIDNYGRYREIMDWCRGEFGDEAWPIHGKPGNWHCGSATVHGWTWIGFATEEMMKKFIERWPSPSEV